MCSVTDMLLFLKVVICVAGMDALKSLKRFMMDAVMIHIRGKLESLQ